MLYDAQGRPLSTSRRMPEASRDAGAFRGSLSHWRGPQIQSRDGTSREREVIQRRAADLMANDWSANATVDTITSHAVGTGLLPKASLPAARLGIAPEQARAVGEDMEWAFDRWMREADVRGQNHFFDLQALGLRSILCKGELLHLAVMLPEKERVGQMRRFSLAIQAVTPELFSADTIVIGSTGAAAFTDEMLNAFFAGSARHLYLASASSQDWEFKRFLEMASGSRPF